MEKEVVVVDSGTIPNQEEVIAIRGESRLTEGPKGRDVDRQVEDDNGHVQSCRSATVSLHISFLRERGDAHPTTSHRRTWLIQSTHEA